ncbi:hypothetical protein AVEN_125204-1 [Araneus ventricosus]|uniref:Integrase catalytic domain-containing protein n=1 Tax=Araneus ventricosus TaxID=182803 RepID=A0A4Y2NK23_ARAVE|nr:hypothetical protein AVEN_125204-1 [Araneus ventricosus]
MLAYKLPCVIYVNDFGFLGAEGCSGSFAKMCDMRYTSKPVVPVVPAPLPVDRINRVAAFEVTGTDLAGPIDVLERRGRSSIMYTDNGTTFLGTSRALGNLNWQKIIAECAIQKIKWHFNSPSAPWYGGWWERMICIIKQLLRKVLGRACVTYEETVTLLCECEGVVNGRPLTCLYDDPNELRAIKPSDFIQDIKGNETVYVDIVDAKHLRKRIRYLQNLRGQLRQRFQKEYLAELTRNPKLPSKRHNLSP